MSEISQEDYKCIKERRAHDIEDEECQAVVYDLSNDFSFLIVWIESGIVALRESSDVPEAYKPPELLVTDGMKREWNDFYMGTHTGLDDVKAACDAFVAEMEERMQKFDEESTGSYSSYSDYSEETDESEDDESDEESEEESEEESSPPRKRRRNPRR